MYKTDFSEFEVGTVFNGVNVAGPVEQQADTVEIRYPSRLEAMALDPAKIADNENLVYEAGQIDFCVPLFKDVSVEVDTQSSDITVSDTTPRQSLVRHAAMLMVEALDIQQGLTIDVKDGINLRHCGLGSSSSTIAGTASAINELFGRPIHSLDLVRYLAQNHGEEIDGDDTKLVPVQCIGGSAVCGQFEGGLIVLSGQATPIYQANLPEELGVVIGVPKDFEHPDSQALMEAEVDNIDGFRETGDQYGKDIAYRLVHKVLPRLAEGNLKPCKDLIFDYRWNMGSINNCSFVYPGMIDIAEEMRPLGDDDAVKILSLSSVGPGFFALTSEPDRIGERFQELGMDTHMTTIHNGKYLVKE